MLASFWLGAHGLDADPMWADEYHSIYDSGGSIYGPKTLAEIWQGIEGRNPWHAPGYFFLLSGWGRLAGWDAAALRALSLLLGMVALAWTYRLGRDWISPQAGLYGAAILGTAGLFTHYLHELRMYTLLLALMLLTIWLYLQIVRTQRPVKWWLWLALLLSATSLLYIHFFALLPLAALGIYHLLFVEKNRKWWRVTGVMALAGVLFLPWADVLRAGIRETSQDDELQAAALDTGGAVLRFLELFSNNSVILLILIIAIAGLVVYAIRESNRARRGILTMLYFAVSLLGFVLAVNLALQLLTPGRARYLLLAFPFFALVAGAGLTALRRWRSGQILASALLIVWMGTGALAEFQRSITATVDGSGYIFPLQTVTRVIAANMQGNDFLLNYLPGDGNPSRSYERMAPVYFDGLALEYNFVQVATEADEQADKEQAARELVHDKQLFWLAYMPDHDTAAVSALRSVLSEQYNLCYAPVDRPNLFLGLYTQSPVCCQPEATQGPPLAVYGDQIALTGLAPLPDNIGDSLPILMSWQLDSSVPPNTYSVALHVVDEAGELVAQADYGLRPQSFSCYDQTVTLEGLAPGDYTLRVGVYAWETGARLMGKSAETNESIDMLPITTFSVDTT